MVLNYILVGCPWSLSCLPYANVCCFVRRGKITFKTWIEIETLSILLSRGFASLVYSDNRKCEIKGVRENGVSCKKPAMSIAEGWLIYVIAGIIRACRVDNLFGFIWILHTSFRCFKRGRCVSINSLFHFFNALLYKIVTKELQIYWWRPVVCNRDRAQTIHVYKPITRYEQHLSSYDSSSP